MHRIGVGQSAFRAGANFGQRGAQLMCHIAGKAALALDGAVQVVQTQIEGIDKGPQLAREIPAQRLQRLIGAQIAHHRTGTLQKHHHTAHQIQRQAGGQHRGQGNTAHQGQVDAPLGAIPVFALGGHHQRVKAPSRHRHPGGQRPPSMAVGQCDIVVARRALLDRPQRQRGTGTAGRAQHHAARLWVKQRKKLRVAAGLVFGHQHVQGCGIQCLQYPRHSRRALHQRRVHALVNGLVDPVLQRQKQHGKRTADAQHQPQRQAALQRPRGRRGGGQRWAGEQFHSAFRAQHSQNLGASVSHRPGPAVPAWCAGY